MSKQPNKTLYLITGKRHTRGMGNISFSISGGLYDALSAVARLKACGYVEARFIKQPSWSGGVVSD